tara:strand:- start:339 stop:974 length:636 start_codon:yes stop_codon:yes gene_type:complete
MADKGETKSYKRQSFNTTEGGLFCGYVQENNAKFAVALRRILPSPNNFKTDHYIALQMNGEYDGAIQMNAPSVLEMKCGEKPVYGEVAGLWLAENGDIRIQAPNGKIILDAETISIQANGGEPSGNIYLDATNEVKVTSDNMKTIVDDSIAFEAERDYNITCMGRAEIDCGDFSVTEGADVALPVLLRGGQGTMGAVKFLKGVMKLIKSIA